LPDQRAQFGKRAMQPRLDRARSPLDRYRDLAFAELGVVPQDDDDAQGLRRIVVLDLPDLLAGGDRLVQPVALSLFLF